MPQIILTKEKSQPAIENKLANAKKFHGFPNECFYGNFLRILYPLNYTGNRTDPNKVPGKIRLLKTGKPH